MSEWEPLVRWTTKAVLAFGIAGWRSNCSRRDEPIPRSRPRAFITGITGMVEHAMEVREKIGAAPRPLPSRPDRVVETEVGVGEEHSANAHRYILLYICTVNLPVSGSDGIRRRL